MDAIVNPAPPPRPGGGMAVYRGAELRAHFAGVDKEFHAATTGCAIMDQRWRLRLRVSGSDAERWLNGMLTNTATLAPGHGNYSFLLSAQGRIQGDAYLFHEGDTYVLETGADQQEKLTAWLDHYVIMDDVTLAPDDRLPATIAVAGPNAATLLAELGLDMNGAPALALRHGAILTVPVKGARADDSCVPCFLLWHAAEHFEALWDALRVAGATDAGAEAQELLRIASGTPLYGVDLLERDLPQETGQQRALHFNKGCYIGQEIVERIHSRGSVHRGWRGFLGDATSERHLQTGVEVMAGTVVIGTLTSIANLPLPDGPQPVGLGIVRLQALAEHKPLAANGIALQAADLPFIKEKN